LIDDTHCLSFHFTVTIDLNTLTFFKNFFTFNADDISLSVSRCFILVDAGSVVDNGGAD